MTDVEFLRWLDNEVRARRLSPKQRDDLVTQKRAFDNDRALIMQQFANQVVGYSGRTQIVGNTVHDVLDQAKRALPDRMVYFEPIGFDLF